MSDPAADFKRWLCGVRRGLPRVVPRARVTPADTNRLKNMPPARQERNRCSSALHIEGEDARAAGRSKWIAQTRIWICSLLVLPQAQCYLHLLGNFVFAKIETNDSQNFFARTFPSTTPYESTGRRQDKIPALNNSPPSPQSLRTRDTITKKIRFGDNEKNQAPNVEIGAGMAG